MAYVGQRINIQSLTFRPLTEPERQSLPEKFKGNTELDNNSTFGKMIYNSGVEHYAIYDSINDSFIVYQPDEIIFKRDGRNNYYTDTFGDKNKHYYITRQVGGKKRRRTNKRKNRNTRRKSRRPRS